MSRPDAGSFRSPFAPFLEGDAEDFGSVIPVTISACFFPSRPVGLLRRIGTVSRIDDIPANKTTPWGVTFPHSTKCSP